MRDLTLMMPECSPVVVSEAQARALASELWDSPLAPGAATAAAHIAVGLRAESVAGRRIAFSQREAAAVMRVADNDLRHTLRPTTT